MYYILLVSFFFIEGLFFFFEIKRQTWKCQVSGSLCIAHHAHQQRSSDLEVCCVRQAGAHAGVQAVDVEDGLHSHLSSLCITRPRSAHSSSREHAHWRESFFFFHWILFL